MTDPLLLLYNQYKLFVLFTNTVERQIVLKFYSGSFNLIAPLKRSVSPQQFVNHALRTAHGKEGSVKPIRKINANKARFPNT